MKTSKVITLSVLILLSASRPSSGTVRTLNNNNPSPGQSTTYAAAEAPLANGDTIYVSGSPTSYGNLSMTKQITLIGTGHNPNKQNPLVSLIGIITLNGSCSNSRFIGLTFNTLLTGSTGVSNIYVARNSIFGNITSANATSGWTIEGNVFTSTGLSNITGSGFSNITIRNNIFNGQLTQLSGVTITNNLFIGNGAAFATTIASCIIQNNIFYRETPTGQSTNCTTSFNCAFPLTNTFSTDDDGNNLVANPLFVNFPSAGDFFNYTYDFRLQSGSPCITNPGSDVTQRGLFGGFPSLAFTMTGEPPIPQIRLMNIIGATTVPVGQNITVNIISTTK